MLSPNRPSKRSTIEAICHILGKFYDVIMAALVRLLFVSFSLLLTINILAELRVDLFESELALIFLSPLLIFVVEFLYALKKCGHENQWFCIPILIYLGTTLPPIMQLLNVHSGDFIDVTNETTVDDLKYNLGLQEEDAILQLRNVKQNPQEQQVTALNDDNSTSLPVLGRIQRDYGDETTYIQILLVVLIVGRWMLPRGNISRARLSELLLLYLGTCSDMLDFISQLSEGRLFHTPQYRKTIQIIWAISLLQFTVVKSSVEGSEQRKKWAEKLRAQGYIVAEDLISREEEIVSKLFMNKLTETDLWELLCSMVLQDLPFLVVRVAILLNHPKDTSTIYFFAIKNLILVLIDLYRLALKLFEKDHGDTQKKPNEENRNGFGDVKQIEPMGSDEI